jgi:signal transduction histidine kinase
MRTVFAQLIGNAVEHGATQLRVEAGRTGQRLVVHVVDDGEGISEGNRERIFEPFFTTRRESGGTGMGLQIVRSMLAAHAGSIELAQSTSGAAFDIRLPLAEV